MRILSRFGELRSRDAGFPHWYLSLVGVDPNAQGTGVGNALLRPLIAKSESDGLPCYLETVEPRNVRLYERLGFNILVEEAEPDSGLRLWTFLRRPSR